MRVSILCLSICIPACAIAQGNDHSQQSPEWKAYLAEKGALRARGTAALTAEYAREKAGDCPNAENRLQMEACLQTEIKITENNYVMYVRATGGLMRLWAPGNTKPTSTTQFPDLGKQIDTAEAAWSSYRDTQCKTVEDYYFGSEIAGGAYLNCKQELMRRHMHELENLYSDLWH